MGTLWKGSRVAVGALECSGVFWGALARSGDALGRTLNSLIYINLNVKQRSFPGVSKDGGALNPLDFFRRTFGILKFFLNR